MSDREEIVARLPRRTAHALHGLVTASRELNMPVTSGEAVLYDEEALNARATAGGLRHAQKLGLAGYTGRYWVPANKALELRYALEERYLRETAAGGATGEADEDGLQAPPAHGRPI